MAVVKRKEEEETFNEPKIPVAPSTMESQILKALGIPPNLNKVQISNVGDHRWRVNIRVNAPSNNTVTVTKIAHSFYLKTDEKGKIIGGDEIPLTYNS